MNTFKNGDGQLSCNILKLAEQVAASGEVINIAEMVEVQRGSSGNLRSLLAMPIRNRHSEIIGKQSKRKRKRKYITKKPSQVEVRNDNEQSNNNNTLSYKQPTQT